MAGQYQVVRKPDILIVEGLNVLHVGAARGERPRSPFVSDFFDFSIYLDAGSRTSSNGTSSGS